MKDIYKEWVVKLILYRKDWIIKWKEESEAFVLWLIWQNIETRQRYHVGNLSSLNGKYTFTYELSGKRRTLFEAMENGYQPHLAFRDIRKTYESNRLFDAFSRMLQDKRRPDFSEILLNLG
jgi:hypothetical protein